MIESYVKSLWYIGLTNVYQKNIILSKILKSEVKVRKIQTHLISDSNSWTSPSPFFSLSKCRPSSSFCLQWLSKFFYFFHFLNQFFVMFVPKTLIQINTTKIVKFQIFPVTSPKIYTWWICSSFKSYLYIDMIFVSYNRKTQIKQVIISSLPPL